MMILFSSTLQRQSEEQKHSINNQQWKRDCAKCLKEADSKKKLDETNRHLTQYSARHYAATQALMRGVDIYDVSINLGTSVSYLERTYSHVSTMMKSKELTKGQGRWKSIESLSVTEND